MADIKDEEHLHSPLNLQSENLSGKNIPGKDAEVNFQNPEREEMETRARTAHKTSEKSWKHYLFEFFMLFLAVFCGFLAENERESLVDHKREIQIIQSLKDDIEKDTAQIAENIIQYDSRLNSIDTIKSHFKELLDGTPSLKIAKIISLRMGFTDFIYTDGTIEQLKNAGNMQLIQKKKVVDSIIHYDGLVRRALIHQELLNSILVNSVLAKNKYIFNIELLEALTKENFETEKVRQSLKNILLVHDANELHRFLNEYLYYRLALEIHRANILQIRKSAEGVLKIIKSEYTAE